MAISSNDCTRERSESFVLREVLWGHDRWKKTVAAARIAISTSQRDVSKLLVTVEVGLGLTACYKG
jgi:hypothetical protein